MSELALLLIEENKQTRKPALDLGNCGLTRVPDAIGDCAWLETLILSNSWLEYDEEQKKWVEKKKPEQWQRKPPRSAARVPCPTERFEKTDHRGGDLGLKTSGHLPTSARSDN